MPDQSRATAGRPGPRTGLWLCGLGVFSALSAAVMALAVFPNGSVNDDEAIYRLQAHTLAGGHLFPAAPNPTWAFVPWLSGVVGHHYVLKYTPVEAAVLAAGHLLTGSYVPALVATVLGLLGATWLLALEVLGDRREALIATAIVMCSPLVIVQSGLLLGYLTTLVLLEIFAWSCIRAVRTGRPILFVLAGLAFGEAGAIRSYDALIVAAPFLVWAGSRIGLGRRLVTPAAWFLLGGAGPLATFLAYNDMATGSPLKLPFNMAESHDTIGFGLRRLTAGEDFHHFGPLQGLVGMAVHLLAFQVWVFGGPVVVALAVLAVRRRAVGGPGLALAAVAVTLPVGYLVFWGPWNAAISWRGIWLIGPFYVLPLVVVAGVAGARGVTVWLREHPHRRRPLWFGAALLAFLTAAMSAPAIAADARYSRQDGQITQVVDSVPGPALIVLPDNPGFIMFPHWNVGNLGHPQSRALYVAASGTAADFALLEQFGDRVPYVLYFSGAFLPHRAHLGVQLNRLIEVERPQFDLRIQASEERLRKKKLTLTVSTGGPRVSCGPHDAAGGWWLHVDPAGAVTCWGAGAPVALPAGSLGTIRLRYLPKSGARDQLDIPVEVRSGGVTLMLPGPVATVLRHVILPMVVTPVDRPPTPGSG